MKPRTITSAGLGIIRLFEGLKLKAYKCPAGKWTIGYGHTGADVTPGLVITRDRADELLAADVKKFEAAVSRGAIGATTQSQFDAMVAFAFNVGAGNFNSSTLLKMHNAANYKGAQGQFGRWNKARNDNGVLVELAGLTRRRAAEARHYGLAA